MEERKSSIQDPFSFIPEDVLPEQKVLQLALSAAFEQQVRIMGSGGTRDINTYRDLSIRSLEERSLEIQNLLEEQHNLPTTKEGESGKDNGTLKSVNSTEPISKLRKGNTVQVEGIRTDLDINSTLPINIPDTGRLFSIDKEKESKRSLGSIQPIIQAISIDVCDNRNIYIYIYTLGINDVKVNIIIESNDRSELPMVIESSKTVVSIKSYIKEYLCIPIEEQILILNGTILEDHKKIIDYNLYNSARISLSFYPQFTESRLQRPRTLRVKNKTGKISNVLLDGPYEPISELKLKIEEQEGIAVYKQRLFFPSIELEDHKFLSDYNVFGGDSLVHLNMLNPKVLKQPTKLSIYIYIYIVRTIRRPI